MAGPNSPQLQHKVTLTQLSGISLTSSSLSLEQHMDMITKKMILIRQMTDSMTDKVYLHSPSKIPDHSLSLYRINC